MAVAERFRGFALALACALALQSATTAQEGAPRPRVALVLSGGGARGAAHAGVLEVLERERIPVDLVVGTSMGAVVGGFYAYGYSPEEIAALLASAAWGELLSDQPRRQDLLVRRKADQDRYPINLSLGVGPRGVSVPRGVVAGQQIRLYLQEHLVDSWRTPEFDELPIPFRCVATDLTDGQPAVFAEGRLAQAIHASMAIPALFAPVDIGDRSYVDGGVVNNMPVDVAKAWGVDVVIAVDLGSKLVLADELHTFLDISEQVLNMLLERSRLQQRDLLDDDDILIVPKVNDIGVMEFARSEETSARGRAAAESALERLRVLSVGEAEYRAWQQGARRPRQPEPILHSVDVASNSGWSPEALRARIDAAPGERFDAADLRTDLDRMYGLLNFEAVDYGLQAVGDQASLEVRATRRRWGPNYLRFGLELRDDFEGNSAYSLRGGLLMTELNSYGGELRLEAEVGDVLGGFADFYQPLDRAGRWFAQPIVSWVQQPVRLRVGGQAVSEVRVQATTLGLDAGYNLGTWGQIWGGVTHAQTNSDVSVGASMPTEHGRTGVFSVNFAVDTLDSSAFPTEGLSTGVSWLHSAGDLGAQTDAEVVTAYAWWFGSLGAQTFGVFSTFNTSLDGDVSSEELRLVQGPALFPSAFDLDRFGPHEASAGAITYHQLTGFLPDLLSNPVYVGVLGEISEVWQTRGEIGTDTDWESFGSAILGVDSLIGPIYTGVTLAEGGDWSGFLFVGTPFGARRE